MTNFFFFLAFFALVAAVGAVTFKNTVYAVLSLVTCFIFTGSLFVLLNAAYFALLMIIVYVGAIAVLFLFIVMMTQARESIQAKVERPFAVIALFAASLIAASLIAVVAKIQPTAAIPPTDRLVDLGLVLYTTYGVPFVLSGFVLLVAMVGAIILDQRIVPLGRKHVDPMVQRARLKQDVVTLYSLKNGEGVD